MEELEQLLQYFRHAEVSELVLQAGKVAALRVGGQMRALTKQAIEAPQLYQMLDPTPLAQAAIRATTSAQSQVVAGPNGPLQATVFLANGGLVLRFVRATATSEVSRDTLEPGPKPSSPPAHAATTNAPAAASTPGPRPVAVPVPAATPAPAQPAIFDPSERDLLCDPGEVTQQNHAAAEAKSSQVHSSAAQENGRESSGVYRLPTRPPGADKNEAPAKAVALRADTRADGRLEASSRPVTTPARPSSVERSRSEISLSDVEDLEVVSQKPADKPQAARRRAANTAKDEIIELLRYGRERQCSDVHLVSDRPVLLRYNGRLQEDGEAIGAAKVEAMLRAVMDERNLEQLEKLGYADFAFDEPGIGRFRANACRHKNGFKGCFRVLAQRPMTLEELGLPQELSNVLDYHQGLAIISGPNGQGKTTTLAALVNLVNTTKAVHIITVEDPVEVLHPVQKSVMSQRQVGRDTATFQSALKAALREDPDVIVIGELRDKETVEMALSAAETGHLVLATMNTPSGAKTIGRLIDLFPPDDQAQVRATLAGTLMVVASQRLVERSDGQGRVAACELITGGVPLWSLIRDSKLHQLPGLMQRGRKYGMIRLADSLRELQEKGLVSEATARRYLDSEKTEEAAPDAAANDESGGSALDNAAALGAKLGGGLRNLIGNKGR